MTDQELIREAPALVSNSTFSIEPSDLRRGKIDELVIRPARWQPGFLGSRRGIYQTDQPETRGARATELCAVKPLPGVVTSFRKRICAKAFLTVLNGSILAIALESRDGKPVVAERAILYDQPAATLWIPAEVYVAWKALEDDTLVIEGWAGDSGESRTMPWRALGEKVWEIQN